MTTAICTRPAFELFFRTSVEVNEAPSAPHSLAAYAHTPACLTPHAPEGVWEAAAPWPVPPSVLEREAPFLHLPLRCSASFATPSPRTSQTKSLSAVCRLLVSRSRLCVCVLVSVLEFVSGNSIHLSRGGREGSSCGSKQGRTSTSTHAAHGTHGATDRAFVCLCSGAGQAARATELASSERWQLNLTRLTVAR